MLKAFSQLFTGKKKKVYFQSLGSSVSNTLFPPYDYTGEPPPTTQFSWAVLPETPPVCVCEGGSGGGQFESDFEAIPC